MDSASLILLIIGSAAAAGIIYVFLRKAADDIASMQRLAAANGWAFQNTPASFGTPAIMSFACETAHWTLTFQTSGTPGPTAAKTLTWHSPAPALDRGMAVMVAPFTRATATRHVGQKTPRASRLRLGLALRSAKGLYDLAPDMRVVADENGDPGGMILATPGQENALAALGGHPALIMAQQTLADLYVILDPTGLRLCLRNPPKDADTLSRIATLGISLRSALVS